MGSGSKFKVVVLFGGRSGEHEVSLRSAASVIQQLDRARFEIIPVGVDKQGHWRLHRLEQLKPESGSLEILADSPEVRLEDLQADVVFPVMHGTYCEDGTLQGFLELNDVAYVGCGVLASSVGMDKEVAKRLARDAGIPIVPFVTAHHGTWRAKLPELRETVARELGFPCFVKPANTGSSLGVHKVKDAASLEAALKDAFQYGLKVLIEKAIAAREIEFSALENPQGEPHISIAGEIRPNHEFYSYEAKYLDDNGAELLIPAKLDQALMNQGTEIARRAFQALECEGMARVDLFLDRNDGRLYFNEVNTLPGFTQISMYPKLWEASGVSYRELLSRLIDLALERHRRNREILREFRAEKVV